MADSKVICTIRLAAKPSGELVINAKVAGGAVILRSITEYRCQTEEAILKIIDKLYVEDAITLSPGQKRRLERHIQNEQNGST